MNKYKHICCAFVYVVVNACIVCNIVSYVTFHSYGCICTHMHVDVLVHTMYQYVLKDMSIMIGLRLTNTLSLYCITSFVLCSEQITLLYEFICEYMPLLLLKTNLRPFQFKNLLQVDCLKYICREIREQMNFQVEFFDFNLYEIFIILL